MSVNLNSQKSKGEPEFRQLYAKCLIVSALDGEKYDDNKETQELAKWFESDAQAYRQWRAEYNEKNKNDRLAGADMLLKKSAETHSLPPIKGDNATPYLVYRTDSKNNQKIVQSVKNWEAVLEHDPRFCGKIRFDEFERQVYLCGSVPWEQESRMRVWGTCDNSNLFSIGQADYGLQSRNDYFDAMKNVAMRHKFHPIRDILSGLKWDGKPHIQNLLSAFLGAEDTPYNAGVMHLFMTAAVARVFEPGCKYDYIVVFVGAQGIGKSSFLQALALDDRWFTDSLDSLDSDRSAQLLLGTWVCELAELKSLARTSGGVDSVKRFISATQDRLRLPYERRADVFPRQCVFCGTTNRTDFLTDETGNRRFLVIECGVNKPKKSVFEAGAREEIMRAWAEAVYIWQTEHPALILPDRFRTEAQERQDAAMVDDGKVGLIMEYLSDKTRTCALDIWQNALDEAGRPQRWQASEINSIIAGMAGWQRMKTPMKFDGLGSQRGWRKTTFSEPDFRVIGDEPTPFD